TELVPGLVQVVGHEDRRRHVGRRHHARARRTAVVARRSYMDRFELRATALREEVQAEPSGAFCGRGTSTAPRNGRTAGRHAGRARVDMTALVFERLTVLGPEQQSKLLVDEPTSPPEIHAMVFEFARQVAERDDVTHSTAADDVE